jgi:HPt (histidine-containing phosphotransfer) domain-containing protein
MAGNRDRLARLLSGFVRDFDTAPARLAADYSEGRVEAVAALAHAVKGPAAYLDARDLCNSADRLEQSARRNDIDAMEQQVPVFRRHLEVVLQRLNSLIVPSVSAKTTASEINISAVLALLAQAEPLIKRGDYAAQSLLDQIGIHLLGTGAAMRAEEVRARFEELELEAADVALRQLRNDLEQRAAREALLP